MIIIIYDIGYGIFTLKSRKKGEFLLEYAGELVDETEGDTRYDLNKKNKQLVPFIFYFYDANECLW